MVVKILKVRSQEGASELIYFLGDKKPSGPPVIEPKIKRVRRPKKTE